MARPRTQPEILAALAALASAVLVAGCNLLIPDEVDPLSDPRCVAYCDARLAKGCAGDLTTCRVGCYASYQAAMQQGKCAAAYTAAQDCVLSKPVLDLGCVPPSDKVKAICKEKEDAVEACRRERDGR